MQYYSFYHWTLLSPPDISATEHGFRFGLVASFFLELLVIVLCSSPVAYWTPTDLRGSSFSVISFCLFILFMEFSWQEYWSRLPFTPPVEPRLCQNSLLWPIHLVHSMAHSFLELCKPLHSDRAVIHVLSFTYMQSQSQRENKLLGGKASDSLLWVKRTLVINHKPKKQVLFPLPCSTVEN